MSLPCIPRWINFILQMSEGAFSCPDFKGNHTGCAVKGERCWDSRGGEINWAMPSDQSGDGSSIGVVCLYLWWLTHTLLDQ